MDFGYVINIFVVIFGLCMGSFLNCYIYRRLPASAEGFGEAREQKKSLKGRSFCPHCKHALSWLDLIPVFSFVCLGGKCRYCHKKISVQYPLVELATGIIFLLIYNLVISNWILNSNFKFQISNFSEVAILFYISAVLIIIFIYDLKHYLIPDKVLLPAIIIAFGYRLAENLFVSNWVLDSNFKFQILNYLLAVLVASGFFLAIFLVSKGKWMGFGDVKLAILMGLLLGLPNVLVALFLAFFFGAIIGVILMAFPFGSAQGRYKKGLKSEIPFGPFLILGTFLALLWGEQLVGWYINMFLI